MISTHLAPGTELVCINSREYEVPIHLVENQVYTLRGYTVSHTGYVAVLLNEEQAFTKNSLGKIQEVGFYRHRFRLLMLHHSLTSMLDAVRLRERNPVDA